MEKEGRLVEIGPIRDALLEFASHMRSIGEGLYRAHGKDAQDLMNEGLEEFGSRLDDLFPDNEED